MMKVGKVFRKTLPFCWAKLLLGTVTVLVSCLLLALFLGIGWLFGEGGIWIGILLWCGSVGVIRFVIMHYFGYMVKAGHIAVMTEAYTTGKVPAGQVKYGMGKVKERFATSNIYFAVDKLVTGAVKQIQRGIEKLGQKMDFIPGMQQVAKLVNFFIELSLGYIDECCLGYTFYKKEQGAFKSACDGVVIYATNIKKLLGNAAKTMLKVVLLCIVTVLLVFIPLGLLFKLLNWSGLIAFLLACFITWVLKFAFLDSYILCQTMAGYMDVAPNAQISFDLYGKLCGISGKFKELFNKGKQEEAQMQSQANMQANMQENMQGGMSAEADINVNHNTNVGTAPNMQNAYAQNTAQAPTPEAQPQYTAQPGQAPQQQAQAPKPAFCGNCGTKITAGKAFCGNCGAKLN